MYALIFPDQETTAEFIGRYKGPLQFGYIFYQVPVIAVNRNNLQEAEDVVDYILTFYHKQCFVSEIDEDFPEFFFSRKNNGWLSDLNLKELENDLASYSDVFRTFFDPNFVGMNIDDPITDDEWIIVRLAFFLTKKILINRPFKYPAYIPFKPREIKI